MKYSLNLNDLIVFLSVEVAAEILFAQSLTILPMPLNFASLRFNLPATDKASLDARLIIWHLFCNHEPHNQTEKDDLICEGNLDEPIRLKSQCSVDMARPDALDTPLSHEAWAHEFRNFNSIFHI